MDNEGSMGPSLRSYLLFALVSLCLLVAALQFSMVSVALGDLMDDLNAPLRWAGWVVTIYTLAQAVSMPIVGRLSDDLGRRTVFVGGLVVFALASLACALAPNVYFLILARGVQGVAAGGLLPSAYGIIGDTFGQRRAQMVGLLSSIVPLGSVIGPTVGGFIVDEMGWRWTYAMNTPVGALVVALLLLMPRTQRRASRPLDVVGAALLSVAVSGIVYALTELSRQSPPPSLPVVAVSLAAGLVAGALFLRHEMRAPEPILEVALLRQREFAFVNALNLLYGACLFGAFSFIPLYAREAYGMTSSQAGLILIPRAVAAAVTSAIASMLLARTGYRRPIFLGLMVMAGGLAIMWQGLHSPELGPLALGDFPYLALVIALTGVGFGMSGPAANNAAIELAPDRIAAITGLRGMFRLMGGALGTAVMVLVASRASSVADGLEMGFGGLAMVSAATAFLVFGIPDQVGVAVQPRMAVPGQAPYIVGTEAERRP
jgi:EmrB/QacA subfamily drug resistance transporter